jgi:hypothetical protein
VAERPVASQVELGSMGLLSQYLLHECNRPTSVTSATSHTITLCFNVAKIVSSLTELKEMDWETAGKQGVK